MTSTTADIALVPLGKWVYLGQPVQGKSGIPAESQPNVILIFGWMGARLPHLLKYVAAYNDIYPDATKIVIRSEASIFWMTESRRKANLAPVVETLEALGYVGASQTRKHVDGAPIEPSGAIPNPRILLHTFSNGGAWQVDALSKSLQDRVPASSVGESGLSPSAMVLDSSPGDGGLKATQKAFLTAVRHPILRRLASLMITLLVFISWVHLRLGGEPPLIRVKKALNDHKLLPWFSKTTPRLYMYSEADDLIPYPEVEAHAETARKEGLEVRLERFKDSPHVAHARADPDRYWGAVKQLWKDVSAHSSH
ncbi:hypothetical protein D9611_001264 [Ephemerocybe angulata]|uniref:Transmembrane protein 53 n=1 Tax=Ephemerocybe angulata TaxID=980116 RepID=A0A8H5CJH2_9AGAR|nr:hypothetical protein D9611_001264 [Tulosesus angulatus]